MGVDMNTLMGDYGFVVNEQVDALERSRGSIPQSSNGCPARGYGGSVFDPTHLAKSEIDTDRHKP